MNMDLRQFADMDVIEHVMLHDEDLYAVNTEAQPDRVKPVSADSSRVEDGCLFTQLKHKSWNMIRLGKTK